MRKIKSLCILLLCLICPVLVVGQHTVNSIPNPQKQDVSYFVSNPDGILSQYMVDSLNSQLYRLQKDTKAEVAVVAVNSIGDKDIKVFAIELFNDWGVGKKEFDNGLLILFVTDQRKITFEVGYGLEGALPDALCKRIQENYMVPYFGNGDLNKGFAEGLIQVDKIIRQEPVPDDLKSETIYKKIIDYALIYVLLTLIQIGIVYLIVWTFRRKFNMTNIQKCKKIKKRTYILMVFMFLFESIFLPIIFIRYLACKETIFPLLSILYSTNIIFAYLYGRIQQKKVMNDPVLCEKCQNSINYFEGKDAFVFLREKQIFEMSIKSIIYTVFKCPYCEYFKIMPEVIWSKYTYCPACNTKALYVTRREEVKPPTYNESGLEYIYKECLYCKKKYRDSKVIRRLEDKEYDSANRSSSGSSANSGSFGGGRSGGGGATSSW